ncbi:MAG: threonine--tRNA ligase [Thermoplasmata archaeon]
MADLDVPRVDVTLPDQTIRAVPKGARAIEALKEWNVELTSVLAALWEGRPVDLDFRIPTSGRLAPLTFEDRAGRDILQHSAAHLLAKALTEVLPEAKPTDGPPTDEGFYYDFEVRPLTPEDIGEVERRMRAGVSEKLPFVREELSQEAARELLRSNPHKLGYLEKVPEGEPVSVYRTGSFVDLCRGPHVPHTGWLEGIHILGFSAITPSATLGSGLQRVRGVAFPTAAELKEYLARRKEAEGRDHRVYGQRQELFLFTEELPGFPFWLPRGMVVIHALERFVREHLDRSGYEEVRTPLLFPQSVYETSGHWDHYRENMFLTQIEDRTYGWKPMNCPGSMLIFRSRPRSYRELPLRLAEFAPLHRLEASGTLHGLTRVRELVQDDAHIFCTEEQVEGELRELVAWVKEAFDIFRLKWSYEVSTRPEAAMGDRALWDRAEATLQRILKDSGIPYRTSPGEGAFYGPKIDIHVRDSLGRPWQTGTIQLDYQTPERFQLEYQGADGELHRPVVIHRTILGSWERFMGVLLEHCSGKLPPWMAPVQVRILPVSDRHQTYADGIRATCRTASLRAEVVSAGETLGKRIRAAEVDRIPYTMVVGDTELKTEGVTLRLRGNPTTRAMSQPEAIAYLTENVRTRSFDP